MTDQEAIELINTSLAEEFEDTTGVSPWSFIFCFHRFITRSFYHIIILEQHIKDTLVNMHKRIRSITL